MFFIAQQPQQIPPYVGWLLPMVVIGILVQFFWSTMVTIAIYRVSKSDRNIEKLDDRVHEVTEKLVDERLRGMTHKISNEVNGVLLSLKDLKDKIADTEKDLGRLGERDHSIEMQTLKQVEALHRIFVEQGASKQDLGVHQRSADERFKELSQRINQMSEAMATKNDLDRMRKELDS